MTVHGKQFSARYEMHRLLAEDYGDLRRQGYRSRNGTLEILLRPGTTAKTLEANVRAASGRRDRGYWIVRGTSLGLGMLIGGGTLILLALIDLFNQLVGATLMDRVLGTPWHGALLVMTFLAGGAAVSFAPRALSADDGWARSLAFRWLNEERRALTRINRRLRDSVKASRVQKVVIWNAFSPDSIAPHQILDCFHKIQVTVELQIHHDQQPQLVDFWDEARARFPDFRQDGPEHPTEAGLSSITVRGSELARLLEEVAGPSAAHAYGLAIQHSTHRVVEPWKTAIRESGKFSHAGIAYRLAAQRFDQLFTEGDAQLPVASGSQWMQRFITDYHVFVPDLIGGVLRTAVSDQGEDPLAANRDLALMLDVRNPAHAPLPEDLKDDVASLFITIIRTEIGHWESPEFGSLLNHYIQLASSRGHYRGINVLAEVLTYELDVPSDQRRLLPQLSIDSLLTLHEPLSIAGHGQLAIRLARWIAPFTGAAGALERASILERIGDFDAARTELDSIKDVIEADAKLTDTYLRRSVWLMLSAGRHQVGWDPTAVRTQLERLDILFAHPHRHRTPSDARELENFWALLNEWEENRSAAIERHQRAIDLPGVPLRRMLGTMINKGRTQRDLAVVQILREQRTVSTTEWESALADLAEAVTVINRGYQGKIEIGDLDESPIGAHNLALARLYQSAICERLTQHDQALEFAQLALEHAGEGLRQLQVSGSTRKFATLSAEAQLAQEFLNSLAAEEPRGWESLPPADLLNLRWALKLNPLFTRETA
ncbi:hypothetical protein [Glutamicibacter sp. NPDC087344]|uniref:hypothetical protein n=1 Tax=Glutamicibacter sp. NPDC087344 TaxID=3363994 RepID=UPI0037FE6EE2